MDNLWYFLVATGIFVAIDSVWLGLIAPKFYKKHIGHILAPKPDFIAAAIFYIIYIIAVVVFVIVPGLDEESLSFVISHGALLGLAMYATYDLTNQATVKNWPKTVTIVDLAWGTFITTAVSTITFLIFN